MNKRRVESVPVTGPGQNGIIPGCSVLPAMEPTTPEPEKPKRTPRRRGAAAGRFGVLNQFVDTAMVDLPASDVRVWLVLFRDTRDGVAATAQSDIARRAGMGKRTVQRAIACLTERGLLRVVRRGGIGRGVSSYAVSGGGS